MAPRNARSSIPGFHYPSDRDIPLKTPERWLKARRKDDQTEGLWRIHNKLYDLNDFINKHPGGPDWIVTTRGIDITEAFESAHLSLAPEKLLERYYVKEAATPRKFPYTFHPNGFYKTLQAKVREVLKDQPNKTSWRLCLFVDGFALSSFLLFLFACVLQSLALAFLAGILTAITGTSSHNFFHQRNNFRMYYWDLMFMSSHEWRISHHLSHHLYPNTVQDMEVTSMEPMFEFLPSGGGKPLVRWTSLLISLVGGFIYLPGEFIKRILLILNGEKDVRWEHFLPLYQLVLSCCITWELWTGFCVWLVLHMACSYTFSVVGAMASPHHHPNIFHDGDTPREDLDWGLCQVDAIRDRKEMKGVMFWSAFMFGDHTLHHLFPTIDHSLLPQLYPVLEETLKEFGVPWMMYSWWELAAGNFQQMMNSKPNPLPPWTVEKRIQETSISKRKLKKGQ